MNLKTLVVDNFQGRLTRYDDGDINSGFAKYSKTHGSDPFTSPGNLTWFQTPSQVTNIDEAVMAWKPRLESGIVYVYAVTKTGKLYKIQVNNPATNNPNFDTEVLLTTLVINSPTFKYGSSIQFYGATEKLFIGHDKGVTKVNFDGTGEAFVGVLASYTSNVPRPSAQFLGKIYFGNGINFAEIDSTELVTSYAKLSPSFPVGTYVKDLDVSPDGNYIQAVVSRIPTPDMTSLTQDTTQLSSSDSYLFLWNGTDTGYTSYQTFNSYSLNSNTIFANNNYTFGYDLGGGAMYLNSEKIISLSNVVAPGFGAVFSFGNMVGFICSEYNDQTERLEASLFVYGNYDKEYSVGLYRLFRVIPLATDAVEVQPLHTPTGLIVSNLYYGSSFSGYGGNQVGVAKFYFSAKGARVSDNTSLDAIFKFSLFPKATGNAIPGVYETQTHLFSKKVQIKQVRIYSKGWTTSNDFRVRLYNPQREELLDKTFTQGSNLVSNEDYAWCIVNSKPTYGVALQIENQGTSNYVITKVEIDYTGGGQ